MERTNNDPGKVPEGIGYNNRTRTWSHSPLHTSTISWLSGEAIGAFSESKGGVLPKGAEVSGTYGEGGRHPD